ncbi:hypothetical protein [Veillonella sp. R32]|uniref:hypothetical protein n=1 Tax=Veillonella sp. R32 TaxID=2021312 RepID=UPI0013894BAB|nr:hypothetical protein [Veillonella sp. R32]KAF1679108.1 hypothetical protein VER_09665 [Veillonella sp. R32]
MELLQQEYARPKELMVKYSISRPTLWRLTQDMKKRPKFAKAFRRLSKGRELINIKMFDDYMIVRTNEIEREG